MEYIRQWKVGGKTFDTKLEAQRHMAEEALRVWTDTPAIMIDAADEVIALLKPFATPKPRKPRANGAKVNPTGKVTTASAVKAAQATRD